MVCVDVGTATDIFEGNEILWEYRWVVSELPNFPDVSRDKIEAMMAEMENRYRAAGSQLRAFHLMKMFTYAKMGDFAAAEKSRKSFEPAPRDWLSDSPRLEQNFLVFYHAARGEYETAFSLSEGVLSGEIDDPGFFGQDSAELLIPLLEKGRVHEAIRVQQKGYPHIAEHSSWLWNIAQHIEFLARIDDYDNALSIVKAHLAFAIKTPRMIYRFFFLRSLWILGERLNHHADTALLEKFDHLLRKQPTFKVAKRTLVTTLWDEITQLSERFDRRNGNEFFAQQLNKARAASILPNPAGSPS